MVKDARVSATWSWRLWNEESWKPVTSKAAERTDGQSAVELGWMKSIQTFLHMPECSHPSGFPRLLASNENQFNSFQSNVLLILQVTINSKIKLRVYVHELLKLSKVVYLGSSPLGLRVDPRASCRLDSSNTCPRVWSSGGLTLPNLAADTSGGGEWWEGRIGFRAVEVI